MSREYKMIARFFVKKQRKRAFAVKIYLQVMFAEKSLQ